MSKPLFDTDFSAIEARTVCWLAGEEWALQEYRDGVDRYKGMASFIYQVPIEEVNKHPQRFVGKQAILGCGFQASAPKFVEMCWKMGRYKIPLDMAKKAVDGFRAKHARLVSYWYDVEKAAMQALTRKGTAIRVSNSRTGPYEVPITFLYSETSGFPFLLCKLPSGRKLAYPRPRLGPSRKFPEKQAIYHFGNIKGTLWGEVDTYGGKLVENITQAVAGDFMCSGAHHAENAGYEIAMLVHDQGLCYSKEGQTAEEFTRLLTILPEWAKGFPLEAEGGAVPFYKKD